MTVDGMGTEDWRSMGANMKWYGQAKLIASISISRPFACTFSQEEPVWMSPMLPGEEEIRDRVDVGLR